MYVCLQEPTHEHVCVIECLQNEGLQRDPRLFLRQDWAHTNSHQAGTKTSFPQDQLISSSIHLTHHRKRIRVWVGLSFAYLWKITQAKYSARMTDFL